MSAAQKGIPNEFMTELGCPCGSGLFHNVFKVKYYPGGIFHPTPLFAPVAVFRCIECGKILEVNNQNPPKNEILTQG